MTKRRVYLLALIVLVGPLFYTLPISKLPVSVQQHYYNVFGERAYREPPAGISNVVAPLSIDEICSPEFAAWRAAHDIEGVQITAVADCMPDNPWDIAVAVKGANNVSPATLMKSLYALDTVEKSDDRDGDGDPDLIRIRLEVMELNGKSPDVPGPVPRFEIAPGITPGLWVFAPKSRGMTTANFETADANRLIRLPAPVIRVEQGDEVEITLENSHYLPHTIHVHGVDHPFTTPQGAGNDGVPTFSEHPTMPGKAHTYWLRPRHAGTSFYHCHVQPHSHILMGLQGMFVVEENRPGNWLQTFNVGAGRVRAASVAVREDYQREYDLHYLELDADLNNRIQDFTDPRLISRSIHRDYDIVERRPEYYVLNGRSFPYTLRESLIVSGAGENNLLRVLNGGNESLALHFHGHKPILTHRDGVELGAEFSEQRDVFSIASAQRIDLNLSTVNDGRDAYGAGAWLLHDHREQAVTSNGIGPGGGVSLVVYEDYLDEHGLPQTVGGLHSLAAFFSPDYYAGKLPVFAGMGPHHFTDVAQATWLQRHRSVLFGLCLLIWMLLLRAFLRSRRV